MPKGRKGPTQSLGVTIDLNQMIRLSLNFMSAIDHRSIC
jgi:hypothetical protein